jgi:hypothetical protein
MKKTLCLLALLVVASTDVGIAGAQSPLKGKWIVSLTLPLGTVPLSVRFKSDGEGEVATNTDPLPLVYRENGGAFSVTVEIPSAESFTGQPLTLLLRGSMSSDNTASGTLIAITDTPDSGPVPFQSVAGLFTATRE